MKKQFKKDENNVSFSNSISDLMASIMVIFILLFIFLAIIYNQEVKYKDSLIDNYVGLKEKVIDNIIADFKRNSVQLDIDNKSGTIKIDSELLFANNEYKITEKGKDFLNRIIPIYVKTIVLNDEIRNELSQIIIEGHTDDVGSYIYNMELSQKRAFEVLKYIYNEMPNFSGKEELKKYITANGKSEIELVYSNNNVDRDKSRRVEIEFKLKDEETLKKIKGVLNEY